MQSNVRPPKCIRNASTWQTVRLFLEGKLDLNCVLRARMGIECDGECSVMAAMVFVVVHLCFDHNRSVLLKKWLA